jgi:hypothetical protein
MHITWKWNSYHNIQQNLYGMLWVSNFPPHVNAEQSIQNVEQGEMHFVILSLSPMQYVKSSNIMVLWLLLMFSVQAVPSLILIQGHFSQLIILWFSLVPMKDNALEMDHDHIPLHHTKLCWGEVGKTSLQVARIAACHYLMSTFHVHRHGAIKWQWHRDILVLMAVTSGILWKKFVNKREIKT